jgi:hypothetical protein
MDEPDCEVKQPGLALPSGQLVTAHLHTFAFFSTNVYFMLPTFVYFVL